MGLTMENQVKRAACALLAMQRHNWEQGTAMQAFLEMGDRETVIAMAHEAVYRSLPDGRLAMLSAGNAATDPCSVGEALLCAYEWTGDEYFKKGLDGLLNWALHTAPRSEEGLVYHMANGTEFWADSFYMLPPFLVAAGYCQEALLQFGGYWKALYDEKAKLLRHRWNDGAKQFTNPAHWGTGNGWALAAMARMIPMLHAEGMERETEEMTAKAVELLEGVLAHMKPDGTFQNNVDEADSFVEVNLSQMTAYTIYRGVADGWLSDEYLNKADCMRKAAESRCNEYGVVTEVCGAPGFDRQGSSPEAQAFFLMMEAAYRNLNVDAKKYCLRKLQEKDNKEIEAVIRSCLIEFGANHEGTAWTDSNLGRFSEIYNSSGNQYWVAEDETGRIVGGVGIGRLDGVEGVCELQKMYCLPETRGTGISHELMKKALEYAGQFYKSVYLETLENMLAAQRFYEKYGFYRLEGPLVDTGHFACDVCYLKELG